jgi:hypothetical protein
MAKDNIIPQERKSKQMLCCPNPPLPPGATVAAGQRRAREGATVAAGQRRAREEATVAAGQRRAREEARLPAETG